MVAVAALLAGFALTRHVFWDDEAYTALFARNVLHTGTLTAWDGHNLTVFRGGETLDSNLIQNEVSPLQFWLAAASMALLGATTLGGRLPFLLCGLAALPAVYYWARAWVPNTDMPPWLPAGLLALNVPFLLYIAQCRYYALVLLLVPALYVAFAHASGPHKRLWFGIGAVLAVALGLSNYLAAAATAGSLAAAAAMKPFRSQKNVAFAAMVSLVTTALLIYVLSRPGVYAAWHARQGAMGFVPHAATLLWRELRDLGPFEFFPLLPVPLLAAPFFVTSLRPLRPLAHCALTVLVMMSAALVVTAAASPQDPGMSYYADMRYVLGVMAAGVFPTAAAIWIVFRWHGRAAGLALAALIVFSNVPYLPAWPARCTLCARIAELAQPYPSGTDALLHAAAALPSGALTMVVPDYMTLPLMFYRPDLRYPNLLDPAKPLAPEARAKMPPWIYAASTTPDALLRGITAWPPAPGLRAGGVHLTRTAIEPHFWIDRTRPELPWHGFSRDAAADARAGWALYRQDAPP